MCGRVQVRAGALGEGGQVDDETTEEDGDEDEEDGEEGGDGRGGAQDAKARDDGGANEVDKAEAEQEEGGVGRAGGGRCGESRHRVDDRRAEKRGQHALQQAVVDAAREFSFFIDNFDNESKLKAALSFFLLSRLHFPVDLDCIGLCVVGHIKWAVDVLTVFTYLLFSDRKRVCYEIQRLHFTDRERDMVLGNQIWVKSLELGLVGNTVS